MKVKRSITKVIIAFTLMLGILFVGSSSQVSADNRAAYIVNFEYNDGTGNATTMNVAEGTLLTTPPEPNRDGYKFIGWASAFDGDTPILWNFEEDVMPAANITLWAAYAKEYIVNFEYNDGTGNATTMNVAEGTLLTTPPEPNRDGYKFIGWASAFDGDTPILWNFEEDLMPAKNITLWAAYEKNDTSKPTPTPGGTDNGNNGNNGNNNDKDTDKLTNLPQTGYNNSSAIMMLVAGLLISGGYLITRRKEIQ